MGFCGARDVIDRNEFYASAFALSIIKAPYFFNAKFPRRGEQLEISQGLIPSSCTDHVRRKPRMKMLGFREYATEVNRLKRERIHRKNTINSIIYGCSLKIIPIFQRTGVLAPGRTTGVILCGRRKTLLIPLTLLIGQSA